MLTVKATLAPPLCPHTIYPHVPKQSATRKPFARRLPYRSTSMNRALALKLNPAAHSGEGNGSRAFRNSSLPVWRSIPSGPKPSGTSTVGLVSPAGILCGSWYPTGYVVSTALKDGQLCKVLMRYESHLRGQGASQKVGRPGGGTQQLVRSKQIVVRDEHFSYSYAPQS